MTSHDPHSKASSRRLSMRAEAHTPIFSQLRRVKGGVTKEDSVPSPLNLLPPGEERLLGNKNV